jgi:hypothetical protein
VGVVITASANPVSTGTIVTFTATPANGGIVPAFQWRRNGSNITGATNPTYSCAPENNDIFTCQLVSTLACGSGNPALSNEIVMTVTTTPAVITLNDITITSMQCFDATQTITVAGDGHTFMVEAGGYATLIAGHNILFMPGTSVITGGYMYGYIAPEGPFCMAPAMVTVVTGEEDKPFAHENATCRVFPNPTTGNFRIELSGFDSKDVVRTDIFNMQGRIVDTRQIPTNRPTAFSLAGNPAGIYLVRIYSGQTATSLRVVKL